MSKLLKLKEWLTVEDAAKRLSITAGEEVTEAHVLRLALDGHLILSVYFVNQARGTRGSIVPYSETRWSLMPPLVSKEGSPSTEPAMSEADIVKLDIPENLKVLFINNPMALLQGHIPFMESLKIDESRYLNLERDVETLCGVWDLPMWGAEALDVEHLYQSYVGGPGVTLTNLEGAFVQGLDGCVYQLQQSWEDNEYQAGSNAQFERIRQRIDDENLDSEVAKKMLAKHAESRQKFLSDVRSRNDSGKGYQNYYPAGGIPSDSMFVVRTEALRALEERLLSEDAQPEKPLHPSERRSASQIIATLAAMAGLDLSAPYAADETLRASAAANGLELPSSPETVVKFLKGAAKG